MKFGPVATKDAAGAVLAHSITAGSVRFRKGHVLGNAEIEAIDAAGVASIIVARLDADDLGEDEAARRLAAALDGNGIEAKAPATGRVNLHAKAAGVFRVSRAMIDAINAIDPAVTIATLADWSSVQAGQMVATVKIIPFAMPRAMIDLAIAAARADGLAVHAFGAKRVAIVQTQLPSLKASVLDKTVEITRNRLVRSGGSVVGENRVAHDPEDVAKAIQETLASADIVVVFGASAVSDEDDVIPAAIRAAGGHVERVGMPVDPGNLLVLGDVGGKPVIGAPGCARSPKDNGFDWVLDRLCADLPVTHADIASLGVGGLLMEIPTRPQPREGRKTAARPAVVAGLLLAAGRSSRMGTANKLLAEFGGVPLVRRSAETLLSSGLDRVVVVTGHQSERVRLALDGLEVEFVENPDIASGLSSSIKAGLAALGDGADGALVALADMPAIDATALRRMADAFRMERHAVIRATHGGVRGNPVLLPRSLFAEAMKLEGDVGARHLIESGGVPVHDVEIGQAASLDVDTPEAMAMAGGRLAG